MKSLLITLIGTITIGTVLPAFAGPDFQLLEQSRKTHAARVQQAAAKAQSSGNSTAGTSQSGGQESQHDKMMKQCMEMMQKS